MIFALRMATELARAKKLPLYVLFVDLMKAYDSVSRVGLRAILRAKGVPEQLIGLIRGFYDGKCAEVAVEGTVSESFDLCTGLGQGCCLAPLLFNVFLGAVMETWEQRGQDKLHWHYRIDGILRRHMDEGSLNKYATWESLMLHDLGYADDAAFITDTYQKLVSLVSDLQQHYFAWGLTMSVEKTEALITQGENPASIPVKPVEGATEVKFCNTFRYLGSQISKDQGCVSDIASRIDKARKAFWSLTQHVWDVRQLRLSVKLQVYRACVLSVLLYGAESWTTTFPCRRKLETFHMKCLRKIAHVSIWDQDRWHLNNQKLRQFLGVPTIVQLISQARLRWLGHLARMGPKRLPKRLLFGFLPGDMGTPTAVGRRSGKWLSFDLVNDLDNAGVPLHSWMQEARKNSGSDWRRTVYSVAMWFSPVQPGPNREVPVREAVASGSSQKHFPKQSFHSIVESCQNDLRARQGLSGFLDAEQQHGSVTGLYQKLNEWLASNCGPGWESMDAQELLEHLVASPDWEPYVSQAVDLGLFLGTIQTVQFLASNCGGRMEDVSAPAARDAADAAAPKAVRRRLRGKQTPPRAPVEPALVGDPVAPARAVPPPPPAPVVGVRAPKSRPTPSYRWYAAGAFVCSLCQRKFPSKGSLANHVNAIHTEGTFREEGFQCALCPRLFAREAKRTQHYTRDHCENTTALVCPHCRSVFPGERMLRLHMAQDHDVSPEQFPGPCPLCVARGDDLAPHMSTVLTFKRHRTAEHFRDFPIAVFRG